MRMLGSDSKCLYVGRKGVVRSRRGTLVSRTHMLAACEVPKQACSPAAKPVSSCLYHAAYKPPAVCE